MNSTYSACSSTLSYVHALHVLLCYSSCPRESFAPSTVFVLLIHLTTISTVHLQPACSLHSLLRLQHVYAHVYIYVYAHLSTSIYAYITSTPFCATSIYVFSGPSLTYNGGNECTATLHSSDRDPTLRLHLHLANIIMITSAELTLQ